MKNNMLICKEMRQEMGQQSFKGHRKIFQGPGVFLPGLKQMGTVTPHWGALTQSHKVLPNKMSCELKLESDLMLSFCCCCLFKANVSAFIFGRWEPPRIAPISLQLCHLVVSGKRWVISQE